MSSIDLKTMDSRMAQVKNQLIQLEQNTKDLHLELHRQIVGHLTLAEHTEKGLDKVMNLHHSLSYQELLASWNAGAQKSSRLLQEQVLKLNLASIFRKMHGI